MIQQALFLTRTDGYNSEAMEYDVQLVQSAPQLTAVVRTQAKLVDLPRVVPQLCGEVWSFCKTLQMPRPGRHLALYLDNVMNIEVGVEVYQVFAGNNRVVCSSLPTGTAVTAAHWGPYNKLGNAHDAVRDWAAKNGHMLAGISWEIYGHWSDDPTKLRTDVFWLLKT
jgi:effector-binding domain-containing protein